MKYLAAVVQLTSHKNVEASLASAEAGVREAAERGAKLVVLPENANFMGLTDGDKREVAEALDGPSFARLGALAQKCGIWLVAGTLPEKGPTPERTYNTSVVFGPEGNKIALYRKIHLFDLDLGADSSLKESAAVAPGTHATVAALPIAKVGLSVCYDLRFPGLYRALARAGAQVLTVPAAFTVPTGRDHWEILLRARAIENQCYVLAAAQVGANSPTRTSYGRSMIIDPWGTVLATCPDRPSIAIAEIDMGHLEQLRARMPCLAHEKPDAYRVESLSF